MRARALLAAMGREVRVARRALGLTQADVARASGVSRSWISRIELGQGPEIGFTLLSKVAAVVGLDLSLKAYPGPRGLRDRGQRDALGRIRVLLPSEAPWRTEVPLPIPGDLRAWDAMTSLWGLVVGVEVEMHLVDGQALERRLHLKVRDGRVDRLVLVVADTRANREALRDLGPTF
jgi:transcriptional regulator with XRE-family HTH domain